MFFSVTVLNQKGPLGLVWIAAHLDKRLKRKQVYEVSIPDSVDVILNSGTPLALRLSSQLLFGLVRLYSRKCAYILEECNAGLSSIHKAAQQPAILDVDEDADPNKNLVGDPENCFELMSQYIENIVHSDQRDSYNAKKSTSILSVSDAAGNSIEIHTEVARSFPSKYPYGIEKDTERRQPLSPGFEGMQIDSAHPEDTPKSMLQDHQPIPDAADEALMDFADDFNYPSPAPDLEHFSVPPPEVSFGSLSNRLEDIDGDGVNNGEDFPIQSCPVPDGHLLGTSLQAVEGNQATRYPDASDQPDDNLTTPDADEAGRNQRLDEPKRKTKASKRRIIIIDKLQDRPATKLTGHSISHLLNDPSSLIIERGTGRNGNKRQKLSYTSVEPMTNPIFSPCANSLLHAPSLSLWFSRQVLKQPSKKVKNEEHYGDIARSIPNPDKDCLEDDIMMSIEPAGDLDFENIDLPNDLPGTTDALGDDRTFSNLGSLDVEFDLPFDNDHVQDQTPCGTNWQKSDSSAPILDEQADETEIGARRNDFTARTGVVLSHLQSNMAKSTEDKLTMQTVLKHKTAIDASRWFFESLVLVTRGHVRMDQEKPYGDITISRTSTQVL